MRTIVGTLLLSGFLVLSGCQKKPTVEAPPEETAPATPQPKAVTPEPKVASATPAAPPAATPELAPPGVFYLLTAVSVETADGILGLKPGQKLQQVRPGVYRADTAEVTLRPDQVTNDMAVARRLAAQDQKNQAAIQQRLATHSTAPSSAASPAGATGSANRATPQPTPDPRIAARNELFQKRNVVSQQIDQLTATINPLAAKHGGWENAARKSPQVLSLLQQYNALLKQRADIDTKISQIQ